MMSVNNIREDGAKALGPHLAKLNNMTTLNLGCECSVFGVHPACTNGQ